MPKRRLLWRLFPSFAAVALVSVLGVGWLALKQVEDAWLRSTRTELAAQADFLDRHLGPEVPADRGEFARTCRFVQQTSGIRVTLLMPDGSVDFDSQYRPEELQRQLDRPEIRRALVGGVHEQIRYSPGLNERVIYLAAPLVRHDQLFGILYLSKRLTELETTLARLQGWLLGGWLAATALAALLAARAARLIAAPLEQIGQTAERLSTGQWSARAPVPDARELAELADRVNAMADSLQKRIGVLVQNNNEQQAVLASMAEGVLAVDSLEHVISMNKASARLLGIDPAQAQGRPLGEVVRNADLSRFISRALTCRDPIQADVILLGDRQRVMQADGSALRDAEGRAIGAVVVLNDVTDFRRLEHIRRDFVANVSHELKTPITSIKGFVETLLDGASQDPVDAERFLRIIAKQADRLHAIIEDLLSLSKIEQSEDAEDIALEPAPIRGVLDAAVHACATAAQDNEIAVKLHCDPGIQARINPMLLEQAVINLLDNAIKYSEPRREVQLTGEVADGEVLIHVADRGSGIAAEHLPRIFERFYRVDRARSRKLGGTGLGLAIVKHIVQAHHGRITIDSTLGVGSTFTIHLPKV
jgi:two-component system phosphate regulon sensor histidine kinase PhoR